MMRAFGKPESPAVHEYYFLGPDGTATYIKIERKYDTFKINLDSTDIN